MGTKIKKVISILIMTGVTLLAFYVGIFLLFIGPLMDTLHLLEAQQLTIHVFAVNLVKMVLSSTATGAIWCGGYIVSHWFYSKPLEDGSLVKEWHKKESRDKK